MADLAYRSGNPADGMPFRQLRGVAIDGEVFSDTSIGVSIVPVYEDEKVSGAIGIVGPGVSPRFLKAIAEKVGSALSRARAAEALKEAQMSRDADDLKSAVLDAMAHEIRNPLNCINIAATTLLSKRPGNAAQQREMLCIIEEAVGRMDRLLDDAAQMARAKSTGLSVKKERQSMATLVQEAVEDMRAPSSRLIHISVPESLPPIECDKGMIIPVLKQLLSNALKYSPGDSPLFVSAKSTGEAIVIEVVDRGQGVAEEERDQVFEKHYRGRAASGTEGTGLGLASAKSIVRAHGGEIWVTSPLAGGAAFHVSLPVLSSQLRGG